LYKWRTITASWKLYARVKFFATLSVRCEVRKEKKEKGKGKKGKKEKKEKRKKRKKKRKNKE
jgi:hypothetical protein